MLSDLINAYKKTSSSLFYPGPGLIVGGEHTLSVDELMRHYVQICDDGSICLVCGKKLGSVSMKRHMREMHLSSGKDYYCPTCEEFFKNRSIMYNHIYKKHGRKGVNLDTFAVKKIAVKK